MSFLDELRKEASAVKKQQNDDVSSTVARNQMILRGLLPRMRALYKHLKEYAESLTVVKQNVAVSYELKGFDILENLVQSDYRAYTDDPRQLSKFAFAFNCRGDETVTLKTQGYDRYLSVKEYLWSHNLRFASKVSGRGEGVFHLEPLVPVSFEFAADVEKAAIRLRVRNMDSLGTSTFTYNPDLVNSNFMEELARYIMRKPNRFDDLSGNRISDDTRRRLRDEVERQKEERDRELTVPRASIETPRPNKIVRKKKVRKKSLFGALFKRKKKTP